VQIYWLYDPTRLNRWQVDERSKTARQVMPHSAFFSTCGRCNREPRKPDGKE